MGYKGPIFSRMMFMPLHNTIIYGDSMKERDGQNDNFYTKAVSSVKILQSSTTFGASLAALTELFRKIDGI